MDGETQSDSSTGAGSGSGTEGQGTSDKVLQALESLTQKVQGLEEKVGESYDYLSDLEDKFNGFSSGGSSMGKYEITEPKIVSVSGSGEVDIDVPNGAILLIKGPDYISSGYAFMKYSIFDGDKVLISRATTAGSLIPLPKGSKRVQLGCQSGSGDAWSYCFLLSKD